MIAWLDLDPEKIIPDPSSSGSENEFEVKLL
jgi:hypothetical protein